MALQEGEASLLAQWLSDRAHGAAPPQGDKRCAPNSALVDAPSGRLLPSVPGWVLSLAGKQGCRNVLQQASDTQQQP